LLRTEEVRVCAYARPNHGGIPRDEAASHEAGVVLDGALLRALGFLSRLRLQIAQLLGVQGAGRAPDRADKMAVDSVPIVRTGGGLGLATLAVLVYSS
jgi:hypothetical protein